MVRRVIGDTPDNWWDTSSGEEKAKPQTTQPSGSEAGAQVAGTATNGNANNNVNGEEGSKSAAPVGLTPPTLQLPKYNSVVIAPGANLPQGVRLQKMFDAGHVIDKIDDHPHHHPDVVAGQVNDATNFRKAMRDVHLGSRPHHKHHGQDHTAEDKFELTPKVGHGKNSENAPRFDLGQKDWHTGQQATEAMWKQVEDGEMTTR